MPAPRESFDTGIILGDLDQAINWFLKQNSDQVYTESELKNELMKLSGMRSEIDFSWTFQGAINNLKTFLQNLGTSTAIERSLKRLLRADKIISKILETPFGRKITYYGIK